VRNGALKEVILSNAGYVKDVRTGGVPIQLPIVQDFGPEWQFIGDALEDLSWSTRPLEQ
jgi:hypothetical protein